MRIVLGSRSPWRKKMLEDMGYAVEVMSADIDESAVEGEMPEALTLRLAREKAGTLLSKIEGEALLITSDTVAVWRGEVRGKPRDAGEAERYVRSYSTAPVNAVGAVVITNTRTGRSREGVEQAVVHFRPMSDEAIAQVIADGCVFGCAGGFCIQHELFKPWIERVDGEVACVAGLPRALTRRLLDEMVGSTV